MASLGSCLPTFANQILFGNYQTPKLSNFEKRLSPIGRALEFKDYYVWCNSPIEGPDGKIHVFLSRWPKAKSMSGWTHASEIAHAVANTPEGPYKYISTVLAPRGEGFWDATTCHNPSIHYIDGKYALFFMGNSNGKLNTQRIGLATSNSLYGPWKRPNEPLLYPGKKANGTTTAQQTLLFLNILMANIGCITNRLTQKATNTQNLKFAETENMAWQ